MDAAYEAELVMGLAALVDARCPSEDEWLGSLCLLSCADEVPLRPPSGLTWPAARLSRRQGVSAGLRERRVVQARNGPGLLRSTHRLKPLPSVSTDRVAYGA